MRRRKTSPPGNDDENDRHENDVQAFRDAMQDVRPIQAPARVEHRERPRPVPRFSRRADRDIRDMRLANDPYAAERESGDELLYLRVGADRRALRQLRRGKFPVAAEADLHGLTERQAADAIRIFLAEARRERWRCVRIIHGKGLRSGPEGPILKAMTASVLGCRDDVVAFASARATGGGTGAVLVLLDLY